MSPHKLEPAEAHYPETDGKPMAESDIHRDLMVEAIEAVRHHFRDDPELYVSGNLFIYYEQGNPGAVVAPDFFAVRGVPKTERKAYKLWEEGKAPGVVLELTSLSTHLEDLGKKRAIYEELGIDEYFIFDPEGIKFRPPLRGYRLKNGLYQPIAERRTEKGLLAFTSEALGLELQGAGKMLRWVDPKTGQPLPLRRELYEKVDEERKRADAAEAELARLRAEMGRRPPPHGQG